MPKNAMNIFTQERTDKPSTDWTKDILTSIALTGLAESDIHISPAKRQHILEFNSSLPRIKRSLIDKFKLVLEKPAECQEAARCSVCGRLLHFNQTPVWYHLIKYNVNCFAAFICWDDKSPEKPNCKCYRRSV